MEIKVLSGNITEIEVDAAIVNLFEGVEHPGGATAAVDGSLGGAITQLITAGEVKGKLNEITLIHTLGRIKPARVVVVGLGKQAEFSLDKIRGVAAEAGRFLNHNSFSRGNQNLRYIQ